MIPLFWSRSISAYSNRNLESQGTDRGIHSQYPLASVTGTDISPIQPSWYVNKFPAPPLQSYLRFESITHMATQVLHVKPDTRVPTNCKFEVDDIEEDWIHSDNYFDYIHMRSLSGAIKDWPRLLEQSYKLVSRHLTRPSCFSSFNLTFIGFFIGP